MLCSSLAQEVGEREVEGKSVALAFWQFCNDQYVVFSCFFFKCQRALFNLPIPGLILLLKKTKKTTTTHLILYINMEFILSFDDGFTFNTKKSLENV